ncbi:AraC family transcriptional regulator [Marinobacteraceae bacterium S3BR75-40.1]
MSNEIPQALLYLSEKRSLFIGQLGRILSPANASSALVVSINGELDLIDHVNKRQYRNRSFLVPAGVSATIDTHDSIIALVFLDALGVDLTTLASKMKDPIVIDNTTTIYRGIHRESNVIKRGYYLLENRPSAADALQQLDEWIGEPAPGTEVPCDERVSRAVSLIRSSYEHNVSVSEIAEEVNISVPRLVQLFKKITGVPIRRFRLWHRIYMTAVFTAEGKTLTEAAVAAGFSDYAHFSRTFKEMGGVNPSEMLSPKKNTLIRVLPPEQVLAAE